MLSTVERLAVIAEISALKARYFRGVDRKDWALLDQVLAPDIVCDYRGSATDPASGINYAQDATETVLHGSAAVIAALKLSLAGIDTAHQGYMPEIEVLDADHARGIWGMHDVLRFPPDYPVREMHGYGYYHEDYGRTDDGWRIRTLRIERLKIDIFNR